MKHPTTYIVSGFLRSGTSMMMGALHRGGLRPALPDRLPSNQVRPHRPHDNPFYELTDADYRRPDFPRPWFGQVIKVLGPGVGRMVVGNYRVVWMTRNPAEIRASYRCEFPHGKSVDRICDNYDEYVTDCLNIIRNRHDCKKPIVLDYANVLDDPAAAFSRLVAAGWPIAPCAAAAYVNPALRHHRAEEMRAD